MSSVNQDTRYNITRASLRSFRSFRNTSAFNYFPKLPPELRQKIWDSILLDEQLTPACEFVPSSTLFDSIIRFKTRRQPNPLLFVNRESRARTLGIFSVEVPIYRGSNEAYLQFIATAIAGFSRGGSISTISPPFLDKHEMARRGTVHLSPVLDQTVVGWKVLCMEALFAYRSGPKCKGQAADEGAMAPCYNLWLFGVGQH
ncbi:hypothetical protein PG985_000773 [Apiospora marii]|uniref:uncharacterized protein n=1 Tax=Apiospora marii TaxID=335849 RepID=UPI00312FCF9B